jgi:hypothetical protein
LHECLLSRRPPEVPAAVLSAVLGVAGAEGVGVRLPGRATAGAIQEVVAGVEEALGGGVEEALGGGKQGRGGEEAKTGGGGAGGKAGGGCVGRQSGGEWAGGEDDDGDDSDDGEADGGGGSGGAAGGVGTGAAAEKKTGLGRMARCLPLLRAVKEMVGAVPGGEEERVSQAKVS